MIINLNPTCTFRQTHLQHKLQEWATCYDCFTLENEGACLSCLLKCHRGHRLGPIKQTNFFCDCGAKGLCTHRKMTSDEIDQLPMSFGSGVERRPIGSGYAMSEEVNDLCSSGSLIRRHDRINNVPDQSLIGLRHDRTTYPDRSELFWDCWVDWNSGNHV